MQFAKWQGLGNDYIIVRARDVRAATGSDELDATLARAMCDRHFGIGSDGVLVVGPSDVADARMVVHNPDGSIAEMCGNGIRMAARFLLEDGEVDAPGMRVETGGGIVRPTVLDDGRVRVDMGIAVTTAPEQLDLGTHGQVDGRAVSMGNPHFVLRRDPATAPVAELGPRVESHDRFPDRTNVELYRVDGSSHVTMRVWERGVGETMACGTGACAVAVAAVLDAGCASPVTVTLPGGDLEIDVDDDLRVTMTGPAEETFRGRTDHELLLAVQAQRDAATTTSNQVKEALA